MSLRINLGDGWVPSQFLLYENRAYVEMVDFEQRELAETFMRFDLQGCRQRRVIDFDVLLNYCDPSRDLSESVAGMIFHMSRCGSTLTTQMLRHSSAHVVIAEADVLGQFLQNFRGSQQQLISSLRNLIALLADTLCKSGQKLIIKWSSWNIFVIDAICKAVSDVPICYQYRCPKEVLVSLTRQWPEWMEIETIRRLHERTSYYSKSRFQNPYLELLESSGGEDVPAAELAARVVGQCCERALKYSDRLLMIPYHDMPHAVFTHIAPHFSIEMSGVEKSRARIESRWDTKAANGVKQFESDSERKKQLASDEIDSQVQAHIEPNLSKLLAASNENFNFDTNSKLGRDDSSTHSVMGDNSNPEKSLEQEQHSSKPVARVPVKWL